MSDDEIWELKRGGQDYRKVYAAYRAAINHNGQPTVILAKTIKGCSLGSALPEPQRDPPDEEALPGGLSTSATAIRIPIRDEKLEKNYLPPYYQPGPDAPEIRYMLERRRALGGSMPGAERTPRRCRCPPRHLQDAQEGLGQPGGRHHHGVCATFKDLMRDTEIGSRFVPIIPDEARTFGMDSLFPTPEDLQPQRAELPAVDAELMLSYKEAKRPDSPRRHQRGRVHGVVHRRRHVVRDPRRADDPDLHLLLDVRVPAHRRRVLGGRRPDGPRLRARAPPPGAPR